MARTIRCPYCGLLQDEPDGVKICARCGGSLENLTDAKKSVFIAYSRKDSKFVDKLVADLKAQGVKTWRDVDDIKAATWGDQAQWRKIVDKALKSSTAMVVVLSPDSIDSNEVMAEWNFFSEQKRPLFPVIAENCDVPYFLRSYQLWDLTKNYGEKINDLSSVLVRTTGGQLKPPPAKTKPDLKKIALFSIIPVVLILALMLFVWPGFLRDNGETVETLAVVNFTDTPSDDPTEPEFQLPSELGTPAPKATQTNAVVGVEANPKPTNTPISASQPMGFVTATPGVKGEDIAVNEAWINSYPSGARIYIVKAEISLSNVEISDITTSENFVGTAPVIFNLPPGSYYVVAEFNSNLFTSAGFDLPKSSDATFEYAFPFDGNNVHTYSYNDDNTIAFLSKLYRFEKSAGDSESLICIALPVPENERLLPTPSIYPSLASVSALPISFEYVENSMRESIDRALRDTGLITDIGEDMILEMMEVLTIVGKVKLETGTAEIILQMHNFGKSGWYTTVYE